MLLGKDTAKNHQAYGRDNLEVLKCAVTEILMILSLIIYQLVFTILYIFFNVLVVVLAIFLVRPIISRIFNLRMRI